MNTKYCKEWIELHNSKRIVISTQHALFCSENPRATPLPTHLRDEN